MEVDIRVTDSMEYEALGGSKVQFDQTMSVNGR